MKDKIIILSFIITALAYSLCRGKDYSVWIKALPVFSCLLYYTTHGLRGIITDPIIVGGLIISMVGDIALDLGYTTVGIAIFTLVMLIYGIGLYCFNQSRSWRSLILIVLILGVIYYLMYPHLEGRRTSGLIYQIALGWMVWRGTGTLTLHSNIVPLTSRQSYFILAGTIGIAANGILYGIDVYLHPIPRDIVIQSYYFGQFFMVAGLRKTHK